MPLHSPRRDPVSTAVRLLLAGLFVAAAAAPSAHAQDRDPETREESLRQPREAKLERLDEPEPPGTGEKLVRFFERKVASAPGSPGGGPVRPVLGGLQSGAGLTVGIGVQPFGEHENLTAALTARASIERAWGVEGVFGRDTGPVVTYAYGRFRHLPQEVFYGLGGDAAEDARADYRLDETVGGALAGLRLVERAYVGVSGSYFLHRLGEGRDDAYPDLEDVFSGAEVPGLEEEADHVAVGGWFELDTRDVAYDPVYGSRFAPTQANLRGLSLLADAGIYLAAQATRFIDVGDGLYDFTRYAVEAQEYIPVRQGYHGFVFREYVSFTSTAGDDAVPFYLLPTLGGSRTLRGFDEFRFRDRHLLLFNAEYRWYVWLFMDMAVFVDAGQVAPELDAFSLDEMEATYGLGFRFHSRTRAFGRVDVGRSREGIKYYVKIGAFL